MERLIAVLTLLAADADQQIAALPDCVVVTDELALLFSDEVLVARPGASLMSASTWMAVEGLGASLTRMSAVPSLWNDGALRCAPEWARSARTLRAARGCPGARQRDDRDGPDRVRGPLRWKARLLPTHRVFRHDRETLSSATPRLPMNLDFER